MDNPRPMELEGRSWVDREGPVDVSLSRQGEANGEILEAAAALPAGAGALEQLVAALRSVSSRERLAPRGFPVGFRWEDLVRVEAVLTDEAGETAWLRRRLPRETSLSVRTGTDRVELRVRFARRGFLPTSQRARYERSPEHGGRIRVEAFELHVVEHCNLRCAHCCNMSPYLQRKVLSPGEVERQCALMARQLVVDVFKIMGGEPLLHPAITEVLRAVRRSGISSTVRLFTNGLLLPRMDEAFWRELDHLTISNYASAPVPEAVLADAAEEARRFDVVLNVKPVSAFSEVMRADRVADDARVQATYDACWLRHRCMVVRDGRFYKCTRAAYAADFHRRLLAGAHPDDAARAAEAAGVPHSSPDLGEALLAHLNQAEPLASCRFCHGGDGPLLPHVQLGIGDLRAGRLVPLAVEGRVP